MTRLQTRIADDLQDWQVILEAIYFVFGEVGHFARIYGVSKALLQLVHRAPIVLHLFDDLFGVEAHERTFEPLALFRLKVVKREPELVKRIFERDDLLQHGILTDLEAEQCLLSIQLLELVPIVLNQFAHLGQRVHVLGRIRYVSILRKTIKANRSNYFLESKY